MPAGFPNQTIFIDKFGSIDKFNAATLYKPGELGSRDIDTTGREWQLVVCDSGPASVAAGDLAFWKNKTNYQVTNKLADAPEGRNSVAGIFTNAVTPGNYTAIQVRGASFHGLNCTTTPAVGDVAVANTGTGKDVVGVNQGTAPTCIPVGVFSSTQSSNLISVDLKLGDQP